MSESSVKTAIVFSLAIIVASIVGGYAIIHRNDAERTISVTGLGSQDFDSDLVVWEGRFSALNPDLGKAYEELKSNREKVEAYLTQKNIQRDQWVFSAVENYQRTRPKYTAEGRYAGEDFEGYELSQRVTIRSEEVQKIEDISRSITDLLNQGVQLYSSTPRYYYTKLSELKLDMIAKATRDARLRAEQIAKESGANLGGVVSAQMGIFQITGRLSGEDYSWSGTFNTADKEKTASITMRLVYKVK